MQGVAPILPQFVFVCCPRAWSVWRPCELARVHLPVAAPVGTGGWGRGGAWRTGSAAYPPRAPRSFGGRGDFPPALGGVEPRRPHGPSLASRGPEGGEWGERGGGVAPWFPTSLPWRASLWPLAQNPLHCRRIPPGGSVWRAGGAGWSVRRPPSGAPPGGPAGQGVGRSPCCGLFLSPPRAGTKAGCFVCALPSTLHWLTSEWCRPVAAHGVPLRAGAGLPACRGHCGSGTAADWRHAAYSSAGRDGGAPPWVLQPSGGGVPPRAWRGGCGTVVPLAILWLSAGRGKRGGWEWGPPRSPSPVPWRRSLAAAGGRPGGPGPEGPAVDRGGMHSSPAPLQPSGARPSCGSSPPGPPLPSLPPPHRVVLMGGGGGVGGCWG